MFKFDGVIYYGISFIDYIASYNIDYKHGGASVAIYSALVDDFINGSWLAT